MVRWPQSLAFKYSEQDRKIEVILNSQLMFSKDIMGGVWTWDGGEQVNWQSAHDKVRIAHLTLYKNYWIVTRFEGRGYRLKQLVSPRDFAQIVSTVGGTNQVGDKRS